MVAVKVLFHRLVLAFFLIPTLAGAVSIAAAGLKVSVDSSGAFDIAVQNSTWHFGGTTGYPVSHLATVQGSDAAGGYSEIGFDFQAGTARHASIRSYWNRRAVLFTLDSPKGGANAVAFPTLTTYPRNLNHIAFAGMFAFPSFYALPPESPWVFFDDAANTFVLSPAGDFMTAETNLSADGKIAAGISPAIAALPAGFRHQTLLVIESGINRAFDAWGDMLTTLHGKVRPPNDADASLRTLGYWTDAGSTYYYSTERGLSYEETLAAVKADFDRQGIALGYLQLDSWFYPKGAGADWRDGSGGIYQYLGAAPLFGSSLANFQQTLGLPLIAHARWIDPGSPYRQQYRISGDVAVDPAYWTEIARYLSGSGIVTYEQDWLADRAQTAFNLSDPDAFLDNMAAALGSQNISMQYCMPTTRHVLQSVRYGNLTTVRASQDRFESARWKQFLYASRLAGALGVWPFTDVLMSSETGNLLLATLSAGPVGVGDRVGSISASNLLRAVRRDGVIVKPDVPLAPLDSTFLNEAHSVGTAAVAATHSESGGPRTHYVFAFGDGDGAAAAFSPAELGLRGPVYVYRYADGTGRLVDAGETVSEPLRDGWLYLVVAPAGPSGIAVLGDTGQFVSMGRKRVTAFTDDGTVDLTVAFAAGETSRTVEGYSPDAPTAAAVNGAAGPLQYDAASGRFRVELAPGADGTAEIRISRAKTDAPPTVPVTPVPGPAPGGSMPAGVRAADLESAARRTNRPAGAYLRK